MTKEQLKQQPLMHNPILDATPALSRANETQEAELGECFFPPLDCVYCFAWDCVLCCARYKSRSLSVVIGRGKHCSPPRSSTCVCYLKIRRVLPQTCVCVLDRTVAWSGVSMRMCPPQCVTCKSVRVDDFDGFVRERVSEREGASLDALVGPDAKFLLTDSLFPDLYCC